MSRLTVIGGTGYAGAAIVALAAAKGHEVTSVSRKAPSEAVAGVAYVQGSALDPAVLTRAFDDADAVVTATSPRGDMADAQLQLIEALAAKAGSTGVRLIVVGGFSSLRPAAGEPRFIEGFVPEAFRAEALVGHAGLELLKAEPENVDWTFVSPARTFGSYAPLPATGAYRIGGEVALVDETGNSVLSAADLALAIVDIVEQGTHRREHVSVVN